MPWLDEVVGARTRRRLPVVLTPTEVRARARRLHALSEHRAHDLPYVAHPLVEQAGVVGGGLGESLAGRGEEGRVGVEGMEHVHHAHDLSRLGVVDRMELRMGVVGECEGQEQGVVNHAVRRIAGRAAGEGK